MLIPQILPDEFVLGFRARVRILNGLPDNDTLMDMLMLNARRSIADHAGIPAISVLAHAAGVDSKDIVCRHSMIPFIRAVAVIDTHQAHGDPAGVTRLMKSGFRELCREAHYCSACVTEDLDFWGIAYWRRSHQIPGIDWCPKHGFQLEVSDRKSFDKLPNELATTCYVRPSIRPTPSECHADNEA